jgi:hypothetical protein
MPVSAVVLGDELSILIAVLSLFLAKEKAVNPVVKTIAVIIAIFFMFSDFVIFVVIG